MFRLLITVLVSHMISPAAFSQITLSGPMQGYTTDSTAEIWLMSKRDKGMLDFQVLDKDDAILEMEHVEYKRWNTYKLKVSCDAGETNQLIINEGDRKQSFDFTCGNKVKDDSFSFLLGSCTFKWGPLLPLAPSNGFRIFNAMAEKDSDLMLWLGDNVYYLLGDDRNERRMFKENLKTRRKKAMATFLQEKQHYAIWDDHDYGPNNSLGDYKNKELSRNVFDQFWANPPTETAANYYSFEYANAEFFMLDGRWFRTEPDDENAALIGRDQLDWLVDGLKASSAKYKFIVMGSQMINPKGLKHERLANYPHEYERILQTAAGLDNVIFLSGDMHYSTVFKNEDFGKALYEFTCSPLTAMRYKIRKRNDEHRSPYVVPETSFHSQNFGKVTIYDDGVTFEVFDRKGIKVSDFTVPSESNEHESKVPATGSYLPETYKHLGVELPYRILYPPGFSSTEKYPVVFFLHGSGERGNDNEKQLVHGSQLFLDSLETYPAIVIYPQCATGDRWGNNKVQDFFVDEFKGVALDPATPSMEALEALMDDVLKQSYTDNDRVYLIGMSMGGSGASQLLAKFPNRFAAAAILAGLGPMEHATALAQTPTSIYHGGEDKAVFTQHAVAYFRAIDDGEGKHRLKIYPGVEHESWNLAMAENDFLRWLFSHINNRR